MTLKNTFVTKIDKTMTFISSKMLNAKAVDFTYNINDKETSHVHLIDVEGYGSHPTIILVHGLGASSLSFHSLIIRLKKTCKRIIAFDLIGHGKTPVPDILKNMDDDTEFSEMYIDCSIKMLASIFMNYINNANEKPILFGHSLGGLLVTKTVLEYGDYIHSIFLSCPVSNIKEKDFENIVNTFDVHTFKKTIKLIKKMHVNRQNTFFSNLSEYIWVPFVQVRIGENEIVQKILKSINTAKFLTKQEYKILQKKLPMYVLFGKKDNILPHYCFEFFEDNLEPNSKTVLHYHTYFGHVPFLEYPEESTSILENFLKKNNRMLKK